MMKRIILVVLVLFGSLGLSARRPIEYQYLEFQSTSRILSSRYGMELRGGVPVTRVGAPAAQTDTTIFRPRARMAFGLTPFSGEDFWEDDEKFEDDYDVYTKEPGELPIGDIPWLWLLICCGLLGAKRLARGAKSIM